MNEVSVDRIEAQWPPLRADDAGRKAPQTGMGEPDTLDPEVTAGVHSTVRRAIEERLK